MPKPNTDTSTPEISVEEMREARANLMEMVKKDAESAVWRPGQSGNPAGRLPDPEDLIELLKSRLTVAKAKQIFDRMIWIASAPEDAGVPYHVQVSAFNGIMDRLVGKPRTVDQDQNEGNIALYNIAKAIILDDSALEGRRVRSVGAPGTGPTS